MEISEQEKRIKKILYRSWYRGCKETDKILGNYVKKNIDLLNENVKKLDELEEILNLQDVDIYDWLSGKKETPKEMLRNSVFVELQDFKVSEEI